MRTSLSIFILIAFLTGCAPAISQQARDRVTLKIPFSDLLKDPQRLKGEVVLLGGKIITTTPNEQGTELVVLQLPLEIGMRPGTKSTSEGRFLVQTDEFLDPAVFAPDRRVTLVGEIQGVETRPLGQTVYRYPELTLIEMKLWPEEDIYREPRFHFGFGVGTHF
ncbi:MAG: Slp family lipoprotein [Desulfosarcinaceae bacterium]|jgi:outer membrane lipoprotein